MKIRVADLSALEEGKGLCVKAEGVSLVLIRADGTVHALENRCPHLGLPLGRGRIANGEIVCPFHGSRFDIRTGENSDWVAAIAGIRMPTWSRALLSFGKQPRPVRIFPVSVEGGDVFVDL